MAKKSAPTANDRCQPIYGSIHDAIGKLGNDEALDVLHHLVMHVKGMIEGLEEEAEDD